MIAQSSKRRSLEGALGSKGLKSNLDEELEAEGQIGIGKGEIVLTGQDYFQAFFGELGMFGEGGKIQVEISDESEDEAFVNSMKLKPALPYPNKQMLR